MDELLFASAARALSAKPQNLFHWSQRAIPGRECAQIFQKMHNFARFKPILLIFSITLLAHNCNKRLRRYWLW